MHLNVKTMNLMHCTAQRTVGAWERRDPDHEAMEVQTMNWIHAGPSLTAAFLGSLVECVEAATIVLGVGTVRGWRSALLGTAVGLLRKRLGQYMVADATVTEV
jgi:hypothetical protein